MRLATRETRSRSKPSRSIVSSPMRTFLSDVASGLQTRELVGVVECREHRSVEERTGVDDDRVIPAASGDETAINSF